MSILDLLQITLEFIRTRFCDILHVSVLGLLNQNAQKVDGSFANEVTNHLFEEHSPKEQTRVCSPPLYWSIFSHSAFITAGQHCNLIRFSSKLPTHP